MVEINGLKFVPYISKEEIADCVDVLSEQINKDYKGKEPEFLIVLKGSFIFAADLLRKVIVPCTIQNITAKSYGSSMNSGEVKISGLNMDLSDKDVVIIEDIIDTGKTLSKLLNYIKDQNVKSVEIVTLLSKPEMREVDIKVKYIGREIDPKFVIGYGLDYDEKGRNLPEIYIYE